MKLRLHHVLLVTVGATLLPSNAGILFVGFQQRAADIQKAYHEHFHLTSRLFAVSYTHLTLPTIYSV